MLCMTSWSNCPNVLLYILLSFLSFSFFFLGLKSKSAIMQAGCTVKTGCQVWFVVKNLDDIGEEEGRISRKTRRRWLVFFNETEYVPSDFVILSGMEERRVATFLEGHLKIVIKS